MQVAAICDTSRVYATFFRVVAYFIRVSYHTRRTATYATCCFFERGQISLRSMVVVVDAGAPFFVSFSRTVEK